MSIAHVLSFSGGKDSTAMYLLAREKREQIERRGHTIEVVFADTGHEHPLTYEYTRELPRRFNDGFPIRWVKADFTADFARKRAFVEKHWPAHGVPAARVERALALLAQPTGIPFLDLCMMKGRFPSTNTKFCTIELKQKPMERQVQNPLLESGVDVWSWQGVRAQESKKRADLPRMEVVGRVGGAELVHVRPIHRMTHDQVFEMHRRHGVPPNPLYLMGMGRVGCMPCIDCTKGEMRQIVMRCPEEIERLAEWEALVAEVSKMGRATFFAVDTVPGEHQRNTSLQMPDVHEVARWAMTGRGGRQFDMLLSADEGATCSSLYGLCE